MKGAVADPKASAFHQLNAIAACSTLFVASFFHFFFVFLLLCWTKWFSAYH